jgi:uncharacterized protein YegL
VTDTASTSRVRCLPTYLLIDISSSMKPAEEMLNETLFDLYDELSLNPRVAEFAFVSILTFSTDTHVVLPMTDLQDLQALPRLTCGGVTDYGRAFDVLRQRIDIDVPLLLQQGRAVLRPVVFFLTDGVPTDREGHQSENWRAQYQTLTDPSYKRRPHIVTFGFNAATPQILNAVATERGAAFLARHGQQNHEALRKIFTTLLNTLVASARDYDLRLPADIEGFVRVPQELIE